MKVRHDFSARLISGGNGIGLSRVMLMPDVLSEVPAKFCESYEMWYEKLDMESVSHWPHKISVSSARMSLTH